MLIPLSIKALGPLAFPETKPGVQFRKSLPYIPGATVYGALGSILAIHTSMAQDEIATLLRHTRCHNAYPILKGDPWSRPIPLTAINPKGNDDTICDSLYERVCWEQQQPAAFVYAPTDSAGRPWEATERGFYTFAQPQAPTDADGYFRTKLQKRAVTQRVLTRVAINRRRGTAEYSRLYSPLVISEVMEDDREKVKTDDYQALKDQKKKLNATRFLGSIVIRDNDTFILKALAQITALGGRQTSGIGSVAITALPALAQSDSLLALKKRIQLMSQRFAAQAKLYQAFGGQDWQGCAQQLQQNPGTIFTINLLSDAILMEQGWLPSNEFSTAMLEEMTGISARLIRTFSTTKVVGGWNMIWQHPKQTNIATRMGSVFVFQAAAELQEQDYQQLLALEQQGIGERRSEGFGQIRICDEFHLLSAEESV